MNETQAAVAQFSIQGPIASKYYGMVGLAMHEALAAGGAPPPALAGQLAARRDTLTATSLTMR